MWLGGFWQECVSRSKSSVTRALMQTMEAGPWWRSQVVCRCTHAGRNNVRLSQPGAPRTRVKTRETSQDSQSQQHKQGRSEEGLSLTGQRSPGHHDPMASAHLLHEEIERAVPSMCTPSWRISWSWWWKPEKLNVFSLVISVQGPEISLKRLWEQIRQIVKPDWIFPRSCSSLH